MTYVKNKILKCKLQVEYSTKAWVTLMNYVYPKLKPNIQEKLITIMKCDASKTNMHLKLRLCMSYLKYHLENDSG